VGDLINRGSNSLETLRFIKDLPNKHVVLGNHDIHLLATASGFRPLKKRDTLQPILDAPDKEILLDWVRHQPMLHYDFSFNIVMTHAGIFPQWSLQEAAGYAKELESVLQGDDYQENIPHLYGNTPNQWHPELKGWDRLTFIT